MTSIQVYICTDWAKTEHNMTSIQMYVCTNWAKTEHNMISVKINVKIEPRLNIYGINSNVCLYKFISL